MFQVSVEEEFAAGHALRGYKGKCENPHGHNYRVQITVEGESLNDIGLLYDFVDLKAAMHATVKKLDHQFMNDIEPFKTLNPSAENIAKFFHDEVTRLLSETGAALKGAPCRVSQVKVWETSTSTATYFSNGK